MQTAWRSYVVGAAFVLHGCAAPSSSTEDSDSASLTQSVYDPTQTDRAIDATLRAGRSIALDAEEHYQAALAALNQRPDAAERLVALAEKAEFKLRLPYLILLGRVGLESDAPRAFLSRIALTHVPLRAPIATEPTRVDVPERSDEHATHQDHMSDLERTHEQGFAAVNAMVRRQDTQALLDVYTRGDTDVATVAAATAGFAGLLDASSIGVLNARGITGTFTSLGMSNITPTNVVLGPTVEQPVEGPQ